MTNFTTERPDPNSINDHYIDLAQILGDKGVKLPKSTYKWLERLLHIRELNENIYMNREFFGLDYVYKALEGNDPYNLNIKIKSTGIENIPTSGFPMVVGNHPLGGPDGMALMAAVGRVRQDIIFPVNDFLLYLPGPRELFVPVDKVHLTRSLANLEETFAKECTLLYFPAGACSRRSHGIIKDLDWKPTFIKKAVKYHRDIVPVYTNARNRNSFYTIANIRKKLGIKFSFEMALLPSEMFAQKGKTFNITFGHPIPWQTFDNRHTPVEWATLMREHVYRLGINPDEVFEA